ncbi:S1 family peptidase [Paractinoplanes rishiriensis]|uniref:Serine protease n=1 Tax=Paractinoplanes rishiriensis TaxID=1050105 RepID=A0A919K4D7_9ACTN|nr:serine protease [Actinoplanes rishiriensis]GIF00576.1 serine protease [Actinoplanes rishiriensis]
MRLRRLLASGIAAVAAATGIIAASAPAQAVAAPTLASTIALNNCSGSLVRFPTSAITDRALLLTNGHCFEGGFLRAGQVLLNQASSRTGNLLDSTGATVGTVQADRLLYATMTGTDVALYRLTSSYASLRRKYGATALTIAKRRPAPGASIAIPSSYWKEVWTCKVDSFVRTLREDVWTWRDSIRYDVNCDTIHGTSGSPVVDATTGQIVGINNTGNDNGAMCTLNNPCEVAPDGTTSAYLGQTYGQQTYWFNTCLTWRRTISLSKPGCLLTKPTT